MGALTQEKIMEALDYAYSKALNGLPGVDSVEELAADYVDAFRTGKAATLEEAANSLIRWQNTKSATSGFVTGLGGLLTMPVTIPANVASVYFIQIRMIGAIAHMAGYDVRNDKVKTLIYSCLVGNAAKEVLKDVGIQLGKKLAQSSINKISGEVVKKINQAVGFRLMTKAGTTGVVNLSKVVPFVGGVIGATVDAVATNTIGNIAVELFIRESVAVD